jgi:hypothetical protein
MKRALTLEAKALLAGLRGEGGAVYAEEPHTQLGVLPTLNVLL